MPSVNDAFAGATDGFRRRLFDAEAPQKHIKAAFHFADGARVVGDHQKVVDIGDDAFDTVSDIDASTVHVLTADNHLLKDGADELHEALTDGR